MNCTAPKALFVVCLMALTMLLPSLPTDGAQTPYPVQLTGKDVGAYGTISYTGSIDDAGEVSDGRVKFTEIRLNPEVAENITCRIYGQSGLIAEAVDIPYAEKFYVPLDLSPGEYTVSMVGTKTQSTILWNLEIVKLFSVDAYVYDSAVASAPMVTLRIADGTQYVLPTMTDISIVSGSTITISSFVEWRSDYSDSSSVITKLENMEHNKDIYAIYDDSQYTIRYSSTYIL